MSENDIRELTAAELNEVSGGLDPLSLLVGGAIALGVFVVADGILSGNALSEFDPCRRVAR